MNQRTKHIPTRMCIVCRNKYEKRRLMRFVVTDEGIIHDPKGKHEGRGVYVCDMLLCKQKAMSTDILGKALHVDLSDADRQRLREIAS